MAIEDKIQVSDVAVAMLDWAGGTPSLRASSKGIASIVDNGVGDVTLNLPANSAVAADDTVVRALPRSSAFAAVVYDAPNSTATAKRFLVFDAAAAALDNVPLTIIIGRMQTI